MTNSHGKRIKELERTVLDHENRLHDLETKYGTIISGIKGIDDKLPKHPIINFLSYMAAGIGIGGSLALFLIVIFYG